jgi:hypothetical protein
MSARCFWELGSNPPVFGVHDKSLVRRQSPEALHALGFRRFAFPLCPASGNASTMNSQPSGFHRHSASWDR